jgi:hypothetical protein
MTTIDDHVLPPIALARWECEGGALQESNYLLPGRDVVVDVHQGQVIGMHR